MLCHVLYHYLTNMLYVCEVCFLGISICFLCRFYRFIYPAFLYVSYVIVHPVCCVGFVSDWTQPVDILSADIEFVSYYLSTKGYLGNPTLGTNLGQRMLAMRTGCMPNLPTNIVGFEGFDSSIILL